MHLNCGNHIALSFGSHAPFICHVSLSNVGGGMLPTVNSKDEGEKILQIGFRSKFLCLKTFSIFPLVFFSHVLAFFAFFLQILSISISSLF